MSRLSVEAQSQNVSQTPPRGIVSIMGTSIREETPGQMQSTLKRLYLFLALEQAAYLPGGVGWKWLGREVSGLPCRDCCPDYLDLEKHFKKYVMNKENEA